MSPLEGLRLSPQQRRLWALSGEGAAFRSRALLRISGDLSVETLRRALAAVVARHEILRTTFRRAAGIKLPVQVIGSVGEAEPAPALAGDLDLDLDLERGPLLRLSFETLSPAEHLLRIELPALCADAAALRNLAREIAIAYGGGLAGSPVQYGDLAQWQNDLLEGEETEPGRARWSRLDLADLSALRLPGARRLPKPAPRTPHTAAFAPRRLASPVASELAARLAAMGEPAGGALLLALWCVLLRRLTGRAELMVAVACDGRRYAELRDAVGLLARFLPLACRLDEGDRLEDVVRRIEESRQEALFSQEAFDLAPAPDERGRWPFGFELDERPAPIVSGGATFALVEASTCLEPFDVRLACVRDGASLVAELHYDSSRLGSEEIARLAGQFEALLASALEGPAGLAAEIFDLEILSPGERAQLAAVDATAAPYPESQSIHQLFAAQAARTPERLALSGGEGELTYAALEGLSALLARRLRGLGVGPESRVGLFLARSPAMVVGLLAVLRAGGAYVPLDPSYPRERLALMIADAGLAALLTQASLAAALPETPAEVVLLDVEAEVAAASAEASDRIPAETARDGGPESLAYVLYTSGSTGLPKGVMVPHRGVVNYLSWCRRAYGADAGGAVPVHSSVAFDLTVTALLAPLVAGTAVELLPEGPGVGALAAALRAGADRSLVKLTPAHLQALEGLLPAAEAAGRCRALVIGGEALAPERLAFWRRHGPETRLINEYGPTETVVGCASYEIPAEVPAAGDPESVPIGRPIQNARLYVLDDRCRRVPLEVEGEIHVGGEGVARGYLGRPERTAAVFLPDPWSERPGGRMYRTGDRGRLGADGELEFLGRRDDQVKIRGFRIELGEVEAALRGHPEVAAAAVLAREDEPGDWRLVAYVVAERAEAPPEAESLLCHLRLRLPEPMLPAAFVFLPALPLTPHGKVDRRGLPAPAALAPGDAAAGGVFVAPRTPVEEVLAAIWAEVLGRRPIGVDDHFFRLGGHSMKAAQVVAKTRQRLSVEIGLQDLFDHPRLADLAAFVETRERSDLDVIERLPEQGSYELSHAQKRLWFLAQQLHESAAAYNVLGAYVFAEALDAGLLARVCERLAERHESLRTGFVAGFDGGFDGRFDGTASEARQVVRPHPAFRLAVNDLRGEPEPEREARVRELAREEARIPFDLERDSLFRARLVLLEERRSAVLLTLHHIVCDGWSMQILFREFFVLYRAFAAGLPDPLPPLRIQYRDVAAWENRRGFERERRYWLGRLAGPLELIRLPFDFPPKEEYDFSGASSVALLSAAGSAALRQIALAHGTTASNVLLTAFLIFLFKLTEQEDLALATTTANRPHVDLENVVGFFVNTLVLRVRVDESADFAGVLRQVTARVTEALAAQGYPFDLLVEELNPPRRSNRQPLFNVCYAFQAFDDLSIGGELADAMRGELALVADLGEGRPTSKFDLTLFAGERDGRFVLTFEYSTELFRVESMRGYLRILERFLETIAAEPELAQPPVAIQPAAGELVTA